MKLAAFVLGSIPILIQFYARKYLEEDRIATITELDGDLNLPRIKEYDFIVGKLNMSIFHIKKYLQIFLK